jgi:hypothetical protein
LDFLPIGIRNFEYLHERVNNLIWKTSLPRRTSYKTALSQHSIFAQTFIYSVSNMEPIVAAYTNQLGELVFGSECLRRSCEMLLNANQYHKVLLLKEHSVITLTSPLTNTPFFRNFFNSRYVIGVEEIQSSRAAPDLRLRSRGHWDGPRTGY